MSTGTIVAPWRFFFPAAACFALVAVPLWLLARGGALAPPVFPRGATWHASEMVFGYALAVIAGYLLPATSTARLAWLAAAWLAARALWPLAPHLPVGVAALLACAFPVALGWIGTRRFRGAKRPRNRIFAAVFVGLAALALTAYFAAALGRAGVAETATRAALILVALLVVVMGGRLIPTATVGALRETGRTVTIRAQPRRETACIGLALVVVALETSAITPALAAGAEISLGAVLLARMKDWHSTRTWRLPEIWPLHLGYAWLALGFLLLGTSRAGIVAMPTDALHAVAIGGIGTITVAMLARMTRLRTGACTVPGLASASMHGLLASATVVRVLGTRIAPAWTETTLWLSAALWSLAFAAFLWIFARYVRRHRR